MRLPTSNATTQYEAGDRTPETCAVGPALAVVEPPGMAAHAEPDGVPTARPSVAAGVVVVSVTSTWPEFWTVNVCMSLAFGCTVPLNVSVVRFAVFDVVDELVDGFVQAASVAATATANTAGRRRSEDAGFTSGGR